MSDSSNATAVSKKPTGRTTAALVAGALAIAAASATAGAVLTDDDSSSASTTTTIVVEATPEEITAAQTALEAVGCYPYPSDGQYGPHTAEAVKAFQAASGLTNDGALTAETSAALTAAAAAGTTVCTAD